MADPVPPPAEKPALPPVQGTPVAVTSDTYALVRHAVGTWPEEPQAKRLNGLLRLMAMWRSKMLANTFVAHQGRVIFSGPFAGMEYVDNATEGALMPRLLGSYESELHPHLAAIREAGVDVVVDVGCAEGYYAVGLAYAWPDVVVHAHDIDAAAREACAGLAARNGVADRVVVRGEVTPETFQAYAGQRVLVMVDAEGAEVDLLRPDLAPALAGMHIIVETHDVYKPGALQTLVERFQATHDITRVDSQPKNPDLPSWMALMAHLDLLLAVWEWRHAPTPWLVMYPKAR